MKCFQPGVAGFNPNRLIEPLNHESEPVALLFQYGSNMSSARLNSEARLRGDAKMKCVVRTVEPFELVFSVWSTNNNCAAADIVQSKSGRRLYGVVYEVPDFLLSRETAEPHQRKSMDAIEGEGTNYVRQTIELENREALRFSAMTYVVKNRRNDIKTERHYVQHLFDGMKEHEIPMDYREYVAAQAIASNPALSGPITSQLREG